MQSILEIGRGFQKKESLLLPVKSTILFWCSTVQERGLTNNSSSEEGGTHSLHIGVL